MNKNTYCLVTGILFTIIAVLHALRLALGWEAMVGGWDVPTWVSIVAVIIPGYLAYNGYKFRG